jgi:tetratricopeptide (TPR) repeat protein
MLPLFIVTGFLASFVTQSSAPQHTAADRKLAEQHYSAGWQALRLESFDESAKEFQAAIDLYPNFTLAYYGLGRAEMGRKHFADATRAYESCKSNYERAGSRQFQHELDAKRAREDREMELKEAIRQTSQGPQGQRTQELIRQFQNELRLVQQNSDRAMNVSIDTTVPPFVTLALGSAYFRAERFADAERAYKQALTADPKMGEAWNNLAVVYLVTSRYAEADTAVKAAEKAGYNVSPNLKDDIQKKKAGA